MDHSPSGSIPIAVVPEVAKAVQRLEALYVKLWLISRSVVREAFARFSSNILEAAGHIQTRVEASLRGGEAAADCEDGGYLSGLVLEGTEDLEMHFDCIDATGKNVEPEDIQTVCGSVSVLRFVCTDFLIRFVSSVGSILD